MDSGATTPEGGTSDQELLNTPTLEGRPDQEMLECKGITLLSPWLFVLAHVS